MPIVEPYMSRQQQRRDNFERAFRSVTGQNLHRVYRDGQECGWEGLSRRERRKLARAYVAKLNRRRDAPDAP